MPALSCYHNTYLSASTMPVTNTLHIIDWPLLSLPMTPKTICKVTTPVPHHTCTTCSHILSVDVYRFCVLCPQELDKGTYLFSCPLSQQGHWHYVSCTGEDTCHLPVGPHTNTWQSNSLIQSFVSQKQNRKTHIVAHSNTIHYMHIRDVYSHNNLNSGKLTLHSS